MSPDLNPMENLWRELKSAISKMNAANLKELEHIAMEEWQRLPADRYKKLLGGYKILLKPVIVAKGSATKY